MPDIRFDVSNPQTPDAGPVIYISTDADKWGRLTITLTNTRTDNSDVRLDPGGVLQIYFEMLVLADIKRIKVPDDSAWAGGPDATGGHIELHPKSAITIPSQTSISLELHDVLGETPRQGKFRFYYPSHGIRNVVIQGFVQRPPTAGNQWGLACTLDPRPEYQGQGSSVYVTAPGRPDIANYLLVHLYRSAGGTLPSAGTPQLSFSFLTGDDDLALCSEDRLKKVAAKIKGQRPAGRWKDPAANSQGDDIIWTVAPTDGGGDLFPEGGLLTLEFDNIVTNLPAGGGTYLFIQYSGLTGYDDGYIQAPLNKAAPVPYVRDFHAEAAGQRVAYGGQVPYGQLTLRWDVFAAEDCLVGVTGQSTGPFALIGSGSFASTVAAPSYTLVARVGGQDYPQPPLIFQLTLPSASPHAYVTMDWSGWDPAYTVHLKWSTSNAASCSVTHPDWGFISSDLSGTWQKDGFYGNGTVADGDQFQKLFKIEVTNPAGTTSTQSNVPYDASS
jgi:hypothetical protein